MTRLVVLLAVAAICADYSNFASGNLLRNSYQQISSSDSREETIDTTKRLLRYNWDEDRNVVTIEELEANPDAYADMMKNEGVWVKWNSSMRVLPSNVIYGGYDNSGTNFVMRAEHSEPSRLFVGKIIGKYYSINQVAYITYNGKSYQKSQFEVFVHTQCSWREKYDTSPMIPGDSNNGQYICRYEYDEHEFWIPGKLDSDLHFCRISMNDAEMSSPGYQVLKQACSRSGSQSLRHENRPNFKPEILSFEEINSNPRAYDDILDDDGAWVYWTVNRTGVPPNAVFGGYTTTGPIFVIMAEHTTESGVYIGRIPGYYNVNTKQAVIVHENKGYAKKSFEILIHNSYVWTQLSDVRPFIPAVDIYGSCRISTEKGVYLQPGQYNAKEDTCIVHYYGQIVIRKSGFEVLKKAC